MSDFLKPGGDEVEFDLLNSAVGEGGIAELIGCLRVSRSVPDPDKILISSSKTAVSTDPALLYALCGAPICRAREETMERLVA